jgi:hypothetical protein
VYDSSGVRPRNPPGQWKCASIFRRLLFFGERERPAESDPAKLRAIVIHAMAGLDFEALRALALIARDLDRSHERERRASN